MTSLRIVFAGTPEFGLPCLEAITKSEHQLIAVYTQPDRAAGRGKHLQQSAVKQWALAHNLPVYQPINFKSNEAVEPLAALQPDVMIVIAYGLILPKKILTIPRLGCINVHASLLPRWRGASPIQQAILHGDALSGVTIMQMDAGMDTGDSLAMMSCPIEAEDTSKTLHDKLARIAPAPLLSTLKALVTSQAKATLQDGSQATYAPKITKSDAVINWQAAAVEIHQLIRAFNPWPVAYTQAGNTVMRIHQAQVVESHVDKPPGTILAIDKHGILTATGRQNLLIQTLQFAGGKILAVADCLNAHNFPLKVNQILQ